MKRTLVLTIALALASFGVSAYAQTAPANQGTPQTQTGKKHKQAKQKKEKKQKEGHSSTQK